MDMHNGFHGSFMHVLEYGEFFKQRGDEVVIGSVLISQKNREIAENAGFRVYHLNHLPIEEPYDLVYSLHLILFPALLARGLRYHKAIHMSLSALLPIERIPPSQFWPQFDLITAISPEVVQRHSDLYQVDPHLFTIVPNHIPLDFIRKANQKKGWNKEIAKICVVSNHFVPELFELAKIAPFEIIFYGSAYNNFQKITPDLLLNYDVIVSIGKTVQYGLGLGIPVFQYDKYGGCGYITPDNINFEEKTNFSGRGTANKMTAQILLKELQNGYSTANANVLKLKSFALEHYSITKLINQQLELISSRNLPHPKLAKDSYLFANAAYAAVNYIFSALNDKEELIGTVND